MNILEFFEKTDHCKQKNETIDFHKQTVCY